MFVKSIDNFGNCRYNKNEHFFGYLYNLNCINNRNGD